MQRNITINRYHRYSQKKWGLSLLLLMCFFSAFAHHSGATRQQETDPDHFQEDFFHDTIQEAREACRIYREAHTDPVQTCSPSTQAGHDEWPLKSGIFYFGIFH